MKVLDLISFILLVIGGLNWGAYGLFDIDLVAYIFGSNTATLSKIVYDLVGIAAFYMLFAGWNIKQRWHVPENVDILDRAA